MEKHCHNPRCERASSRDVSISVGGPFDPTKSLCVACKAAFDWGVRHGQATTKAEEVWVVAVTYQYDTIHAEIVKSKHKAIEALASYLRANEDYVGPAGMSDICDWMAEHDERLGIDLFSATLDLS